MNRSDRKFFCVLYLIVLSITICMPIYAKAGNQEAAQAYGKTSMNLFREVVKKSDVNENILISPDSIITAMTIVENGAAGKTLSEMKHAFGDVSVKKYNQYLSSVHQSLSSSKAITYKPANAIWYNKDHISVQKAFRRKVKASFDAEISGTRFDAQAAEKINRWVSRKTRKKIRKIIDRLEPSDRAVIVNAVYFKGAWMDPYAGTHRKKFTDAKGNATTVNMLEGTEDEYITLKRGKGFVKYYSGGKTAFLGILPPKGMSVKEYVAGLSEKDLISAYRKRKTGNVIVRTRMPEFTCSYETSMKKSLQRMGIRRAFTNHADFSKMSNGDIHIDDVLHKTYIKLDKNGTEAAAVTAVVMKANSVCPQIEPKIYRVYLDRPFVYAIIDTESGAPLFMGVVNHVA